MSGPNTLVCDQHISGELLSAYRDGEVPAEQQHNLAAHIASCPACQARLNDYARLADALRLQPTPRAEDYEWLDPSQPNAQRWRSAPRVTIPAWTSKVAALVAALALVVTSVAIFALHGRPAISTISGTPTPVFPVGADTGLNTLAMVSPSEGWAMGSSLPAEALYALEHPSDTPQTFHDTLVMMHYHNGKWQRVASSLAGYATSLSMDSSTDGWATLYNPDVIVAKGTFTSPPVMGHLIHYDGTSWKEVPTLGGFECGPIQALSASNVWALCGYADSTPSSGFFHYDGTSWTAVPIETHSPNILQRDITVQAFSMISPSEGWLIGGVTPSIGSDNTVILHYMNGYVTVEQTLHGMINSISMDSATDGWASGSIETDVPNGSTAQPLTDAQPLLLHYSAGIWSQMVSTSADEYGPVNMFSSQVGCHQVPTVNRGRSHPC